MKVRGNNILVSGLELDAVAHDVRSEELDAYLSEILSLDIEYYQDEIDESLECVLKDWYEAPGDYTNGENVPRDRKIFREFIKKGTPLRARDAATLLDAYLIDEPAKERAESVVRIPRSFAREIAAISICQAAEYTEKANTLPVDNLMVYREVQAMPDAEHARRTWARIATSLTVPRKVWEPYYNEFKRKRAEEDAGESLNNALMLARVCGFSLSKAVRSHIDK